MNETELTPQKFLSPLEVARLWQKLVGNNSKEALMIELLATYGMRGGELRALRARDINQEDRTILIRGSKGSRNRIFPLSIPLYSRLLQILNTTPVTDDSLIFPISRFQLMRIWDEFKPCIGKTMHSLRHTAAIRLYQEHKDIQLVQNILGHRRLLTTLIYQQHVYSTEKFKEVFHV